MDKSNCGWIPVDCNMDVDGVMRHLKFPSRIQMMAMLKHLGHDGSIQYLRIAEQFKEINYVVDVGGNTGSVAILLAVTYDADVLTIEPVTMNYDCLEHNVSTFPGITPLKMGVYHKKARLRIAMPTQRQRPDLSFKYGNTGLYTMFGQDTSHAEPMDVDTLDNIVTRKVDFLKLDIEGGEYFALQGATRILIEDRPIIMMEAREDNMAMSGYNLDDYHDLFGRLKYTPVGRYMGDIIMMPNEISMEVWTYDAFRDRQ